MSQLIAISGCDNSDRKADVVYVHGLGGMHILLGDTELTNRPHGLIGWGWSFQILGYGC